MMEGMLKRGQVLIARNMQSAAVIEDTLGEGAQAEVYRARIGDAHYALKWYRPEYLAGDQRLWERLKVAINSGTPTEQFLWPFDLVSYPRTNAYGGYLMPIKTPDFVSMVDLMRRQAEPSFRALTIVGFRLAHSFLKLHAAGLCYRDINFGNVFFNPRHRRYSHCGYRQCGCEPEAGQHQGHAWFHGSRSGQRPGGTQRRQ